MIAAPKAEAVEKTFAGIASRYDLANHLLSFGLDFSWRRRLVEACSSSQPERVLDLATGSGDVAFALRSALPASAEIIGLDFCQAMLDQAELKAKKRGGPPSLSFVHGDCLDLPFDDASFDAVTIAFGLRNFEDRSSGLAQIHRILRPGGTLLVLEFTQPERWFRPFYYLYLRGALPILAWIVTRDRQAYRYLGSSIQGFPDRAGLTAELLGSGFSKVSCRSMTASIVAIHEGKKSISS